MAYRGIISGVVLSCKVCVSRQLAGVRSDVAVAGQQLGVPLVGPSPGTLPMTKRDVVIDALHFSTGVHNYSTGVKSMRIRILFIGYPCLAKPLTLLLKPDQSRSQSAT